MGFWEDVNVANCLRQYDIYPYDTRDSQDRERFHPFTPASQWHYRENSKDWFTKYTQDFEPKFGEECCSREGVSYHYIKDWNILRTHAIYYGYCETISTTI